MLRWIMPLMAAVVFAGPVSAADGPVATKHGAYRAASKLPPGLPRAHYKYRTTVAPAAENARATAAPMPRLAPVTSATLPSRHRAGSTDDVVMVESPLRVIAGR